MATSVSFNVTGMKCGGCESNIKEALTAVAGVLSVTPSHKEDNVAIEYDENVVSEDAIIQAITDAGFSVQE